jgi:hypothetical protein
MLSGVYLFKNTVYLGSVSIIIYYADLFSNYSKVFGITFVAIKMESYHTFAFAVQVIIISLSISNDNLLDATNKI